VAAGIVVAAAMLYIRPLLIGEPLPFPFNSTPTPGVTPFPDLTPTPIHHAGQTAHVATSPLKQHNLWSTPSAEDGIGWPIVPVQEGTVLKLGDIPIWGPILKDGSKSGWWWPVEYNGRTLYIADVNLQ
jgi:hypothetical protein